MSEPASDQEHLRAENERLRTDLHELRARLWEPEEIVRAIREGEVDAFVVSEQIYTLRSADLLYRRMIEDMKEGPVSRDPSGRAVDYNASFAALVTDELSALLA